MTKQYIAHHRVTASCEWPDNVKHTSCSMSRGRAACSVKARVGAWLLAVPSQIQFHMLIWWQLTVPLVLLRRRVNQEAMVARVTWKTLAVWANDQPRRARNSRMASRSVGW